MYVCVCACVGVCAYVYVFSLFSLFDNIGFTWVFSTFIRQVHIPKGALANDLFNVIIIHEVASMACVSKIRQRA